MIFSSTPEKLKKMIRPIYYYALNMRLIFINLFINKNVLSYFEIPIVINNYNRLQCLKDLITALHERGYYNIHILDNDSTYPELLDYYSICPCKVHKLGRNYGYKAIWESGFYKRFKGQFYVYTDSDVVMIQECPNDFMEFFFKKLLTEKKAVKVGFSLKIDDLPDYYKLKPQVLQHEKQYFESQGVDGFYLANIDTTFALYKPGYIGASNKFLTMYRSPYPYEARHTPWYVDLDNMSTEESFYLRSVKQSTHWSSISVL